MVKVNVKENNFIIEFDSFFQGASPAAHLNSLTELGNSGHYASATNIDLTDPTSVTQGPALSNLTAGTQAGAITEVTNFILDQPPSNDVTYAIGATKLQKLSSTAVTNAGAWPHTITNATDGESCIEFQGSLYYFYNKSSGGDIGKYDLSSTFDDDWGSTVPTGAAALQKAPHPVAKKEDIMFFGNGRYAGTYISATTTIDVDKLDFGANTEVADVCFHANQWWIAVNSGVTSGTNRTTAQVYLYDGGAINSILSDEVAVGVQKIGFLHPMNGRIYICYRDESGANVFGMIVGRGVQPLSYFTGNLPTYEKKTLYKNFVIFESSGLIYAAGYAHPDLPYTIFQLADGGYATCGALAAPFGTPIVASTDGGSNHRLAKFSGYDTTCTWTSIVVPLGGNLGHVDRIRALTNTGGTGASCALTLKYNQAASTSNTLTLAAATRRHVLNTPGVTGAEDLQLNLSWSAGSASNPLKVRKVVIYGHFLEG